IASSHCENDVGYPLVGIQRMKQDGWGRRRHWLPRNFCRLLGLGCPKQAFAKIAALSALRASMVLFRPTIYQLKTGKPLMVRQAHRERLNLRPRPSLS
ncbi:MAG: hypothetical protein ACXV8Q_15955, partial [Methylobacter sp.]